MKLEPTLSMRLSNNSRDFRAMQSYQNDKGKSRYPIPRDNVRQEAILHYSQVIC